MYVIFNIRIFPDNTKVKEAYFLYFLRDCLLKSMV